MNIHHKVLNSGEQKPVSQPVLDDVCRALSGILSDGVDVHRCLAAKAFGRIGAPEAVQPLIAALLDEDEDVRTDAAEALLALADPQAGQQLFENLLGDPCTEVKLAAIETLAKLQDKKVIPWLQRMVRGRDEEIVWDEEEFYASGWDDWVDIQIRAVNALAELNAGVAVPDIVAAMQDENAQDMTEAAFKALALMGQPGIEALAGYLDEKSTRLRRRAAASLAASDAGEAAEPLARAFSDSSAEVRIAAMRSLAVRNPQDSRLAEMLEDPDANVRAGAVQICGLQQPGRLVAMIEDASQTVQIAALSALKDLQDYTADDALEEALRENLENGTAEIAAASARAFAHVAPQAAIDDLISLLGDTGKPLKARLGALQGLAEIGGERAVDALARMVGDEERTIRLETMPALARLSKSESVWPNNAGEALLFALRGGYEPEPGEESEAESAASTQEPAEANEEPASEAGAAPEDDRGVFPTSTMSAILDDTPNIREAVKLPDDGVELTSMDMERLAIAKQIKGKKRVSLVPNVVRHEDIRSFAARVLGDLYHDDVAHELAGVLNSADAALSMAAADSLARIGEHINSLPDAVTQILIERMASADRDLKLLLIRALAAADSGAVHDFLIEQILDEDSFIRAEAVRALARQGRAGPEIEALLDDPIRVFA